METLVDKLLQVIRDLKYPEIKAYYFGDPITYPQYDLPAVYVAPSAESISPRTIGRTGMDDKNLGADITIVRSAKDGMHMRNNESPIDRWLIKAVDEIVTTLRADITLGGTVVTLQGCTVNYAPAVMRREAVRAATIRVAYQKTARRGGG
jgi:hypothetical protein